MIFGIGLFVALAVRFTNAEEPGGDVDLILHYPSIEKGLLIHDHSGRGNHAQVKGLEVSAHPPSAGDHFWDGMIQDLRVYRSALTADDLAILQRNPPGDARTDATGRVTLEVPDGDYLLMAGDMGIGLIRFTRNTPWQECTILYPPSHRGE